MDAVGRMIAIIIGVIVMIFIPIQYISQEQGDRSCNIVNRITNEFADTARYQGYFTEIMYNEYLEKIGRSGDLYDISLEVSHPVSGTDTTAAANALTKNNNLLKLASESHIHTDACYAGHRHGESGCTNTSYYSGRFLYSYEIAQSGSGYTENGYSSSYRAYKDMYGNLLFSASYRYHLEGTSMYQRDPDVASATVSYLDANNQIQQKTKTEYRYLTSYTYVDSSWTQVDIDGYGRVYRKYNPNFDTWFTAIFQTSGDATWLQLNLAQSYFGPFYRYDYSWPYGMQKGWVSKTLVSSWSCSKTQDETPICNQVVMGIAAPVPAQTVNIGEDINTIVNAVMLDGSSKLINCTASGYDKYKPGKQIVTLTYTGLINNAKTTGTKTCTVIVTVNDKVLTNITVEPADITVQRYTEADKLPITVTAYYKSGESIILASGYTVTGYTNSLIGKQNVTISYTQGTVTKTVDVTVTVTHLKTTCPVCGYTYEFDDNDVDNGCPYCSGLVIGISATPEEIIMNKGNPLDVIVTANYENGESDIITGWESDYNPNLIGFQNVKITYMDFYTYVQVTVINKMICPICKAEYELNEDGSDPGCPNCSAEVVGISAEPKDLKVKLNSNLKLTVTATYRDGHKAIITGWTTAFSPDTLGSYEATIYYKKASDKINITVYDNIIKCPYCGLEYEYFESPDGCPQCSKTIVGIEAALRDGGIKVIYQSQPNIQVTLIYKDMHTEKTYSGWTISGYRQDILGEQTIKVFYHTFSTDLTLEVINNPFLITCPTCGTQYYFNEDGTDPGCPSCTAAADKDNTVKYFDIIYTDEIVEVIYKDGIYRFQKGDYFTIKISMKTMTLEDKIRSFFCGKGNDVRKKEYIFGGEVDR